MISKFKVLYLTIMVLLITVIEHFPQNKQIENQVRLAKSFEAKGDFFEAEQIYANLYNMQPQNYQLYNFYYNVLVNQKKYDDAFKLTEKQINLNKNNVNLYGDLGTLYFFKGDEESAKRVWNDALKIQPDNAFAYRTIADYMIDNRVIESAIEVLILGNQVSDDNTIFSYDIANLYSITMKYEEATREYCKILAQKPKQLNMIKNRILSYINANQATEPTLNTIEDIYEKNNQVFYLQLLADLYSRTGNNEDAFKTILQIEKETTQNGSVIFNFAQQESRFGNYNIAAQAYKFIIDNYSESSLYSEAEIGYARSLEDELNNAINNKTNWKPLKSSISYNSQDYWELISAYSSLVNKYPDNKIGWEAEFRTAKIFLDKLRHYNKADSIFNKIINKVKTLQYIDESNFSLAEIAIKNENLEAAENYLIKVLESRMVNSSLRIRTNFLLAKIKVWKGEFSESIELFNKVIENPKNEKVNDALQYSLIINTFKNDSTNLFSFFYADYLVEKDKFSEAIIEFNKLAENQDLFLLKDFAALQYAELLLAENQFEEAREFLEKTSNSDEDNIFQDRFLYLLGLNYYYGVNEKNKALESLTKIFDEYPNSIYFNKARTIIAEISTGVK